MNLVQRSCPWIIRDRIKFLSLLNGIEILVIDATAPIADGVTKRSFG
jgi:hypothetical protein